MRGAKDPVFSRLAGRVEGDRRGVQEQSLGGEEEEERGGLGWRTTGAGWRWGRL